MLILAPHVHDVLQGELVPPHGALLLKSFHRRIPDDALRLDLVH